MAFIRKRRQWGIQPPEGVALDLSSAINDRIAFAWGAARPSVSLFGRPLTPTNAVGVPSAEGVVSRLTAGYWVRSSYAPIVTTDGAGGGDFSVLVRANTAAVATAQILFSQRLNSGAFPQLAIIANSTGGGSASSGRIEFLTFNGALVGSSVASRVNGAFHSWLMVRNGTTVSLWEDGQQIASTSGSIQTVWNSGSGLGLGANYHAGLPSTCDLSFAWASNRALSDSEAADLSGDYKIAFEPRRIWVPVSAAGSSSPVGLSTETDTALALSAVQIAALGRADETDAALALAAVQATATGRADETDTALALVPVQSLPVGLAVETDSALALSAGSANAVGTADETDTAFALAGVQIAATGISLETDTALALTGITGTAPGIASESDTAFALAAVQKLLVGVATETDTALAPTAAVDELSLILKILRNRQELNAATGMFTLYDDDGTTVLYQSNAWADAAGTIPYSGGVLARIDALA